MLDGYELRYYRDVDGDLLGTIFLEDTKSLSGQSPEETELVFFTQF